MGLKLGSARRDETLEDVSHVFLDVGGTLLYSEPSASEILHRIFAARGHFMDRGRVVRLLRTPETIVTLVRPFPAGREKEFFREMNARIVEHLGLEPDGWKVDEVHDELGRGVAEETQPDAMDTVEG